MEIIIDGVAYKGTSGDDDFTVSTNLQNITIQGYQGADNVELQASLTYTRIWTADDDDLISIDDSLINSTIGAGAGQDILTVSSTATVDETKFWGGADDDGITIDGSLTNSTLGAGSGSDTLSISSTATVDGSKFWNGPNNDDISVSGSLKNSTIGAGSGEDNIVIDNASINGSIIRGGNDDDVFLIDNLIGDHSTTPSIHGGKGDDAIDAASAGQALNIYGGKGDDTITAGTDQIVYGGEGADLFIVEGTNVQIMDFDTEDQILINTSAVTLSVPEYEAKLTNTTLLNSSSSTFTGTGTLYLYNSISDWYTGIASESYYTTTFTAGGLYDFVIIPQNSSCNTYTISDSTQIALSLDTTVYLSFSTAVTVTARASTGNYKIILPTNFANYECNTNITSTNLSAIGFGTGSYDEIKTGFLHHIKGASGILNSTTTTTDTFVYSSTTGSFSTWTTSTPSFFDTTYICSPTVGETFSFSESYLFGLSLIGSTSTTLRLFVNITASNTFDSTIVSLSFRPSFTSVLTKGMPLSTEGTTFKMQPYSGKLIQNIDSGTSYPNNSIVLAPTFTVKQLAPLSFGSNAFDNAFGKLDGTATSTLIRPFRVLFMDTDSVSNGLYIVSGSISWKGNDASNYFHGISNTSRQTLIKGSPNNLISFDDINYI